MSENTSGTERRSAVRLEVSVRGSTYPFVTVTEDDACVVELAGMLPRRDGRYAEFFNVTGEDPDEFAGHAASHGTVEVTPIREYEDGGMFEFLTAGNCPAVTLAEFGALPREAVAEGGVGRIVAEVPPQYDATSIVDAFLAETPDAEFVSKRETDGVTPLFTRSAFEQVARGRLTERQYETLRAAFEAGYYDWPRGCTGGEVAEELGITSATFSEHVRAAERKLLTLLFSRP